MRIQNGILLKLSQSSSLVDSLWWIYLKFSEMVVSDGVSVQAAPTAPHSFSRPAETYEGKHSLLLFSFLQQTNNLVLLAGQNTGVVERERDACKLLTKSRPSV